MVALATINLNITGVVFSVKIFGVPLLVGLFGGSLLGVYRRRELEKSKKLDEWAQDLDIKLKEVQAQKIITENLLQMVERIPLPMYLKNNNHQYLLANGKYEGLTGKSWLEINGKTDYDLFAAPIADLFREQDQEVFDQKKGKIFEETIPLPSGILTFETFKFPLINEEGDVYAVGGICTDITKLKLAEDTLKSQQERLNVVLREMNEAVIATDCDAKIVMFNKRAAELTGYDPKLSIGQVLDSIYKPININSGADITFWKEKDGRRSLAESPNQEVILKTKTEENLKVIQKTKILLDRFGQNMGLLVLFDVFGSKYYQQENQGRAVLPPDEKAVNKQNEFQLEKAESNKIKIMVMDDDPLIRKTCTLMLETVGYKTLLAQDGQEAIDLYEQYLNTTNPIRVVVMDLTVHGAMGGVEATTKILQLDPDAKIIVASGYSNDPILADFVDYGFLARVEKPFSVKKLIETIQALL